jgi:hypothetical protein
MRKLGIVLLIIALAVSLGFNVFMANYIGKQNSSVRSNLVFGDANSRDTYFTVHNVAKAHEISRGKGVKAGILDNYFGYNRHRELYAGGANFSGKDLGYLETDYHGYWMAVTLKEIAPEAEVYALGVDFDSEEAKVRTMLDAIEWAIDNDLDVLTYSSSRFSEENEKKLNVVVDEAMERGIVTTFIHYYHPGNILPDGLFTYRGEADYNRREPDLNILHYDYNVVIIPRYLEYLSSSEEDRTRLTRPFMSISSTSPVTAGFVALMKSVKNDLTTAEYKRILMETARSLIYKGEDCPRVPDVYEAVKVISGVAGQKG